VHACRVPLESSHNSLRGGMGGHPWQVGGKSMAGWVPCREAKFLSMVAEGRREVVLGKSGESSGMSDHKVF